jgi:hypothetical protein
MTTKNTFRIMKSTKVVLAILLITGTFAACKKDKQDPELAKPTVENIEVGLNNNEMGVIGSDFHLNADIIAGDKIDKVEIKILPKAGETYSKAWKHEIVWDQYKGAKNANVHKHFDIPKDAAEGKYDFLITIYDENGSQVEVKKSITIYLMANVPVNPKASIFNIFTNGENFYYDGKFSVEKAKLKKGDLLHSQVAINDVKGDGKMYILFINKKLNHRPESIDKIDFSKAIVYDVMEHKGWANPDFFTNSVFDPATFTITRNWPDMTIGGTKDNNIPSSPITGSKAWETGTYYYGVVYKNTTYNIGYFKYIEVAVEVN